MELFKKKVSNITPSVQLQEHYCCCTGHDQSSHKSHQEFQNLQTWLKRWPDQEMGIPMIVEALISFLTLNLHPMYQQEMGETLTHVSTNFQSVLWQKISSLDHHRFLQTIQEYCHLIATMSGVHGTCEISEMRNKSFYFNTFPMMSPYSTYSVWDGFPQFLRHLLEL